MKVSGLEKVMEVQGSPWPSKFQPLGCVAVVARNTGAAIKGRDALNIVWDDGANSKYDSAAHRTELEEAARKPGLERGTDACPKCGEQLKLITKIFNSRTGRTVHLLGCKCGKTTRIPEMS